MWVQAVGIVLVVLATGFAGFATGAALLGVGTAMVYPTLLAAIGDVRFLAAAKSTTTHVAKF